MKAFTCTCIILLSVLSLSAKEYAVVSSKSYGRLSAGKIKAIYLKKISFLEDTKIIPLNLGSRDPIRRSFERKVLRMNFSRLKSYWIKQHYLGHRPPITMKSQESVKAFVKKVEGAIGYMELEKVDGKLQILYKWSD